MDHLKLPIFVEVLSLLPICGITVESRCRNKLKLAGLISPTIGTWIKGNEQLY